MIQRIFSSKYHIFGKIMVYSTATLKNLFTHCFGISP